MELPDGRLLVVDDGILAETASGDGRVVLWLPGPQVDGSQCWDRVVTAAGAAVTTINGVSAVAVALTPARRRPRISPRRFLLRLVGAKIEPSWSLPGRRRCERAGPRRTDLALAWTEDDASPLDESRIRNRWPDSKQIRRIGPNLALVSGIEWARPEKATAPVAELPPAIPTLQLAAHALAEARQAGDRSREVTALVDLAVSYLHKFEAHPALSLLEEAIVDARQLGDRERERDAIINQAQAVLMLGRPEQAIEILEPVLAEIRQTGDRYTEKIALERLGLTRLAAADNVGALNDFDQALAIARILGDAQHEATLLWYAGIAYAELGRPDRAIALAEASVGLLYRLEKPQADQYAQYLAAYRGGSTLIPSEANYQGIFSGTVVTATPAAQSSDVSPASGPGLLRMALTATNAATTFAGSGFKTVSSDVYRARLAECSRCEMFTGVRCRVCGCISSVKARLPYEHCPARKWPA